MDDPSVSGGIRGIGAIFLGVGAWFLVGRIADRFWDWAISKLPHERPGAKESFDQEHPAIARMEKAGEQITISTRKGLPFGIASTVLGLVLIIFAKPIATVL